MFLENAGAFPDAVRFFWSLHGVVLTRPPEIHTDGYEPTLDSAKARLKRSWERWLEWSDGRNDQARTARRRARSRQIDPTATGRASDEMLGDALGRVTDKPSCILAARNHLSEPSNTAPTSQVWDA